MFPLTRTPLARILVPMPDSKGNTASRRWTTLSTTELNKLCQSWRTRTLMSTCIPCNQISSKANRVFTETRRPNCSTSINNSLICMTSPTHLTLIRNSPKLRSNRFSKTFRALSTWSSRIQNICLLRSNTAHYTKQIRIPRSATQFQTWQRWHRTTTSH